METQEKEGVCQQNEKEIENNGVVIQQKESESEPPKQEINESETVETKILPNCQVKK